MTASRRIAEFALGDWTLPEEVRKAAALHALDALGVGLAASAGTEQARWRSAFPGSGAASCLVGGTAPPPDVAMVNGALIHSLEYDDTHIGSVIHGSAVALPAALAAAEAAKASGREALCAFTIAWEVMIRIGRAAPGAFQAHGLQVTSVAGALGAAAAAARLMGLTLDETVSAIGIAGSQASGLLAFLEDGSTVKALNPGWAASTGLRSAALARAGMSGPERIIESPFGIMRSFAGAEVDLAPAFKDLGETWHLPQAAFKLYPVCHYIHPFLEALEELVRDGLTAVVLDHLTAHVAVEEAPLICEPWPRRQAPRSGYDGKWGLAYCLALHLMDGRLDVASFEVEPREDVTDLARKMSWEPVQGSGFPRVFPARLVARSRDGRVFEATVKTVRGAPGRPIADAEVLSKFKANAGRVLEDAHAEELARLTLDLATLPDLSPISAALRR